MAIDFSPARWQALRTIYARWWAGELNRPLVPVMISGRDPGRAPPRRWGEKLSLTDPAVDPEEIVDHYDYQLAQYEYLTESFPHAFFGYGPSVLGVFLGAEIVRTPSMTWFHAPPCTDLGRLHFEFDPNNRWFVRLAEVQRLAAQRWHGQVQIGMTDLGGVLDVLSMFVPPSELMLAMIDQPEEVERLIGEIQTAWFGAFDALSATTRPWNPGFSSWCQIFSEEPYYMLQSDFSFMLGPSTFDRFVLPELRSSCQRLVHSFYHLDGVGQLPLLDRLAAMPELWGIQWIAGPQAPSDPYWLEVYNKRQGNANVYWDEVYRRIRRGGKKIQLNGHLEHLDHLVANLGDGRGVVMWPYTVPPERRSEVIDHVIRYGATP